LSKTTIFRIQIEEPRPAAQARQRTIEMGARRYCRAIPQRRRLQVDEELLARRHRAVAKALGIAAREQQLRRREEWKVEDLLLVGDELANAVGDLNRGAFEFDHRHGDAVQVKDDIGPALIAAVERHLLGERAIVSLRVLPVDQMHAVVGRPAATCTSTP
jgi:hypothetical protein